MPKRRQQTVAQRLGRVLERVTRQSGRLPETPAYGSWLLGRVAESQARRRIRIQVILTVFVLGANLLGIGVAALLVTVAFPCRAFSTTRRCGSPSGSSPATSPSRWLVGVYWITRRTVVALRWAIEERKPTREDERNTFLAPWRVANVDLILWGVGAVLLTTLYGLVNKRSSRGFCSPSASAAFWWPPPATCSPSSRCGRWPHRRWRPDARPGG